MTNYELIKRLLEFSADSEVADIHHKDATLTILSSDKTEMFFITVPQYQGKDEALR